MVLGRFWEGLGTVLGGFWQGLGAFWVLLGITVFCWAFLGHAGFCWRHHECFPGRVITNAFLGFAFAKLCCALLGLAGLSWPLLVFLWAFLGFAGITVLCWAFLGYAGLCWCHHECFPGRVITNFFLGLCFC